MVQKDDHHLLVCFSTQIHSTVYPITWLIPFCLTSTNLNLFSLFAIAVFNGQGLSPNDHGDTVVWV